MKKLIEQLKLDRGFTLIEMALVLFIISVLLLLVIPNVGKSQQNAQGTGDEAIVTVVDAQMELYRMNETKTPSLSNLVSDGYLSQKQVTEYNRVKGNEPSN